MIFSREKQVEVAQKIEEDKIHNISFVGLEKGDIVYFLAKLLEQYYDEHGFRSVLLIDNSYAKDLFGIFNQHNTTDDIFVRNRITVVQDVTVSKEYFDQFSFVIMFHGFTVDKDFLDISDLIIAQTDYIPSTYKQLQGVLDDYEDLNFIFRDWQSKKIKESYIENEIGIPHEKIVMRSIIKMNPNDALAYYLLCHNGSQKLSKANLSDLYSETLRYLTEKITGADEKSIQKLFKKASK